MTWEEPESGPPRWFTRDLTLGDQGEDVLIVQRKVDAPMTGTYDDDTAARVRGVQKTMAKKQTGVVDAKTAKKLGEKPGAGQKPEWLGDCGEIKAGCACPAVAKIRVLLGQPNLPVYFDTALEDAVRRYQSAEGLKVTGVVDLETATLLADRSL